MAARPANQPTRRVSLQPALALASVPDAILGAEHPSAALTVEDREVAHGEPKCSRLKAAVTTFLDQHAVASFRVGKGINSHAQSIARRAARAWGA
jgi:hypothetical protein